MSRLSLILHKNLDVCLVMFSSGSGTKQNTTLEWNQSNVGQQKFIYLKNGSIELGYLIILFFVNYLEIICAMCHGESWAMIQKTWWNTYNSTMHNVPRLEQEDFKDSTDIWSQEAYGHNQNIYNKHTLHQQPRAKCMCRQTNIVLVLLWLKIGSHMKLGRWMVEMCKASINSLWQ